jgi:hypothetical protein
MGQVDSVSSVAGTRVSSVLMLEHVHRRFLAYFTWHNEPGPSDVRILFLL